MSWIRKKLAGLNRLRHRSRAIRNSLSALAPSITITPPTPLVQHGSSLFVPYSESYACWRLLELMQKHGLELKDLVWYHPSLEETQKNVLSEILSQIDVEICDAKEYFQHARLASRAYLAMGGSLAQIKGGLRLVHKILEEFNGRIDPTVTPKHITIAHLRMQHACRGFNLDLAGHPDLKRIWRLFNADVALSLFRALEIEEERGENVVADGGPDLERLGVPEM